MLLMIFEESVEKRATCENQRLFQHPYTFELRQKMSIKASNYYLIFWRFKATEKVVVHWLQVLR